MIARFYNDDSRRPIALVATARRKCMRLSQSGILPAVPALVRSGGRFGERARPDRRHLHINFRGLKKEFTRRISIDPRHAST